MSLNSNLNSDQAKNIADRAVFECSGKHLNDTEMLVLKGSWDGLTYEKMSQIYHLSHSYLQTDVGHKLWQKLSAALGERVRKPNFREALVRRALRDFPLVPSLVSISDFHFPEGAVPLDSAFYLERVGVDAVCDQTLTKPGALVRIKAPRCMGKTSLMLRTIAHAQAQNHETAYLDLSSTERGMVANLEKFLRRFCKIVGNELHQENQIDKYWDADTLGSNDNCTVYFEEYLLPNLKGPLVLGLDNVDYIFAQVEVVEDFLGMLRSWHEKAKISPLWGNLRIVMAHSTECYVPLDMNQSPFNAGVPIELNEFDHEQVLDLTRLYDLSWDNDQVRQLMKMVGGHPYLIGLALYKVKAEELSLEKILTQASTEQSIYGNHLRTILEILRQSHKLVQALRRLVISSVPMELDSMEIYQLHSLGLVQQRNNYVLPRCDMYREYFIRVLSA